MASKIQSYTFYVAITPYKVEHGSEEEFNELSVMAAYDDRRKYFYVDLHAGWKTSWGSHGCIIMGDNNPLTAPKFIKVKDAPKNSQKFINEMGANLEQAKDVIAWLFDKRDWGRLYPAVQNIALHGYLDAYRQQMEELMKTADPEPKQEQKPNVLKQYAELKAKKPDAMLLFRHGDFYETYEDDAAEAAKVLGITLTKSTTTSVRMAGFPHHALDTYLPKLIRAGKRVAICDQLEDPKLTKKLVKRGITELVSPATNNDNNNQNSEDDNMRLSINSNQESANVQPAAQVTNAAIKREQSGAGSGYAEREQGRPKGNETIDVNVGEVTVDSIQPHVVVAKETTKPLGNHGTLVVGGVPKPSEKGAVKSEKSAAAQTSSVSPQTSSLPRVTLVVYTTKRGEQAPRIEGFGGENDPRWKRHYDDKVRLAKEKKEADAFNEKLQDQMKGKPKAEREKLRKQWKSVGSDPFGASYFTDRTTGDKCYQMTMGAKYLDVARDLVDAYNSGDEQAIAAAEQAIIDCKNGIVKDIETEKAAKRAEREAKKAERQAAKQQAAAPAMSSEEQAMFDLFKKFMAGDKDAMAKVGAVMKAA